MATYGAPKKSTSSTRRAALTPTQRGAVTRTSRTRATSAELNNITQFVPGDRVKTTINALGGPGTFVRAVKGRCGVSIVYIPDAPMYRGQEVSVVDDMVVREDDARTFQQPRIGRPMVARTGAR